MKPKPTPVPEPVRLIYVGELPRMNSQHPSYWYRWNLKRKCLRQFGVLPQGFRATQKAHVTITRVLGKGQRLMDAFENLPVALKGLMDALVEGGYLVDDKPRWMSHDPVQQDETRRQEGPRVEVQITYQSCDLSG